MYDVRLAVAAAQQGRVLHPVVLGAVATTLATAARLEQALQDGGSGGQGQQQGQQQFAALKELAAGIGGALPELRAAIERCIQVAHGLRADELLEVGSCYGTAGWWACALPKAC